jgi:hypothetical protein
MRDLFVFPGAIDKGMMAEIKLNGVNKVRAHTIDLKDLFNPGIDKFEPAKTGQATESEPFPLTVTPHPFPSGNEL